MIEPIGARQSFFSGILVGGSFGLSLLVPKCSPHSLHTNIYSVPALLPVDSVSMVTACTCIMDEQVLWVIPSTISFEKPSEYSNIRYNCFTPRINVLLGTPSRTFYNFIQAGLHALSYSPFVSFCSVGLGSYLRAHKFNAIATQALYFAVHTWSLSLLSFLHN